MEKRAEEVTFAVRGRVFRWSKRTGRLSVWSQKRRAFRAAGPMHVWFRVRLDARAR